MAWSESTLETLAVAALVSSWASSRAAKGYENVVISAEDRQIQGGLNCFRPLLWVRTFGITFWEVYHVEAYTVDWRN